MIKKNKSKDKNRAKIRKKIILRKNNERMTFLHLFTTIRMKLIGVFLIPVGLIIILGLISYSKSSEGLIKNYESSSISNLDNLAYYLDFGFESVSSKAAMLNSNSTFVKYYSGFYNQDKVDEQKQYATIQSLVSSNVLMESYVSNIYVFGKYGKCFGISADGSRGTEFYDKFMEADEGLSFVNSRNKNEWKGFHTFLDDNTVNELNDYSISYMSYLYNSSSKPNGFVILDVSTNFVMEALEKCNLSDKGIIAFITPDGRELNYGEFPEKFTFFSESYFINATKSPEMNGHKYVDLKGMEYMFIFSKVETSGSILCALIPKGEITKQAEGVKKVTTIIVMIACFIAIFSGTNMAAGISNVLQKTNNALERTAEGDLTVHVSLERKDEFNILGQSINNMICRMMSLIRKMAGVSKTVSNSATAVSSNSIILLQATKNITSAVSDIETGIIQQAEDAQRCLVEMSCLVEQINTISENTKQIDVIAGNTKAIVDLGFNIIDDLGQKSINTSDITQTVIQHIENLEIESRSINSIIKTINDITEQTNLLSLNATIEAARAGEAGRGFSIVAEEIRKLAAQSAYAANQISNIVIQIQSRTNKTVEVAKQAKNIVASQEITLKSTVTLFTEINEHVESLSKNLTRISNGIGGIEHAKEDTLNAIESISAISEQTASAANELGIITEEQLKAVEALNLASNQLEADAKNLEESVCIFKIDEA